MKLEARMSKLEAVVTTHLEESGAIRADLAWLKKAMWALVGAGVTFTVTFLTGILTYLVRK